MIAGIGKNGSGETDLFADSREDDKIILTAGPGCKLDKYDFVEINVVADHGPDYVRRAKKPERPFNLTRGS